MLSSYSFAEPLITTFEQPSHEAAAAVMIELRDIDEIEENKIEEFRDCGCSCSFGPSGTPCCQLFSSAHYAEMREWSIQLTRKERDLVMKSLIVTLTSKGDTTKHASDHRHKSQARKQEYTTYMHLGMKVCQTTFLFLHSTGRFVFKSLKKSSREIGMQERVHGNSRKAPHNAFTFDNIKHVTTFIVNYAEHSKNRVGRRRP